VIVGKNRNSWPTDNHGVAHLYVRRGKDLDFVATVATLPFARYPEVLQWGSRVFVLDRLNPRRTKDGEEQVYVEGALAYTLDTLNPKQFPPDLEEPVPGS
jgi:hypothetical protein